MICIQIQTLYTNKNTCKNILTCIFIAYIGKYKTQTCFFNVPPTNLCCFSKSRRQERRQPPLYIALVPVCFFFLTKNKAFNFILQAGKAACPGSKMEFWCKFYFSLLYSIQTKQATPKPTTLNNFNGFLSSPNSWQILNVIGRNNFFFRRYRRKTIKALFGLIFLDTLWISSKEKRTCYLNKASFSKSVLSFALWRQTFLHSCKEAKAFFWYEGDNCHTMSFPWWSLQWVVEGMDLKCTVVQCSKGKLQRQKRRAGPFANNLKRFQSNNQAFLM